MPYTKEDEHIDRILSKLNKLNMQGKFDEVNDILKNVDFEKEYISGMICYLSSTKYIKENYPYRKTFVSLIKEELKRREETEERIKRLIGGLE